MPSRGTPRLLITSVAHSTHPGKSHCDCDGLLVDGNIWANNQLDMQDLCCLASVTAPLCRNGSCWEKVYTSRAKASKGEGFCIRAGIGGYSTSTVALLFLGALTVVLATAPRAGEEPYSTPAGERPLPWEYDAQEVAAYWAQRWAIWAAALHIPRALPYNLCSNPFFSLWRLLSLLVLAAACSCLALDLPSWQSYRPASSSTFQKPKAAVRS